MADEQKKQNLRHSLAHLLAAAVLELYPEARPTIGPAIENGFYYDFDFGDTKISDEDLPKVQKKMKELLPSWKIFTRIEVSADEARQIFKDNEYKLELIEELEKEGQAITFYYSGPKDSIPKPPLSPPSQGGGQEGGLASWICAAAATWRTQAKT